MAPGILPVAISFLMKSLTRTSPAGEKLRGPTAGASARALHARQASAAAMRTRRKAPSILHGFIDELLQRPLDALALARRLLHQHEEHVLLAVDHEIAAGGAVPFQFAEIARRRRSGVARIGPDRETEAKAKAVAREVEIVAPNGCARADRVGRHLLERLGLEIGLAFKGAAAQQHLHEARIVRHGRDHAA